MSSRTKKTNMHIDTHKNTIKLFKNSDDIKFLLLPDRHETITASIYFYFKVGSKNESPEINGISHFIEHMIFKGSPNFKSYLDISKTFDANGISFNAFTSKDITAYHYKFLSPPAKFEIICKITSDMILHPLMRDKDILTERNVIKQELKDGEDDIDEIISDTLEYNIFKGHSLDKTIIGTLDTLDNIKQKELLEFHKKYYRKDNLLITFSGNMKHSYTNILNKYFSSSMSNKNIFIPIDINKQQGPITIIPYEEQNVNSTISCYPKNLKQDYVSIIFKTKGMFDPHYYNYKILSNILGGNMSSRLFIQIREKLGLVYSISCSITNYEEVGYFSIDTQNENKDTIQCINAILHELKKLISVQQNTTGSITEIELKETKKNYCDIFTTKFDDIEYENEFYSKQLLYNKIFETIDTRINKINKISIHDLTNTARQLFDFTKMHIITFGKITKQQLKKLSIPEHK